MSRWIFKWNRKDAALPQKANDWSLAFGQSRPLECYGRAEGRGGETLSTLSPGNVALAYQADDRSFYGVVRVLSVQPSLRPPYLIAERTYRFAKPVKLSDLIEREPLLEDIGAFRTGGAESMRRLSPDEYRLILEGCGVDAAARARLKI